MLCLSLHSLVKYFHLVPLKLHIYFTLDELVWFELLYITVLNYFTPSLSDRVHRLVGFLG